MKSINNIIIGILNGYELDEYKCKSTIAIGTTTR
jgi:hypothetical protein